MHAHHLDYSDALKVRWLCPLHHREEHRHRPPIGGGKVGRPSLGADAATEVVKVRVTAATKKRWQSAADKRGVTLSTLVDDAVEAVLA